jgi:hypothetical protein
MWIVQVNVVLFILRAYIAEYLFRTEPMLFRTVVNTQEIKYLKGIIN